MHLVGRWSCETLWINIFDLTISLDYSNIKLLFWLKNIFKSDSAYLFLIIKMWKFLQTRTSASKKPQMSIYKNRDSNEQLKWQVTIFLILSIVQEDRNHDSFPFKFHNLMSTFCFISNYTNTKWKFVAYKRL